VLGLQGLGFTRVLGVSDSGCCGVNVWGFKVWGLPTGAGRHAVLEPLPLLVVCVPLSIEC